MLIVAQNLREAFNIEIFDSIYIYGNGKGWHLVGNLAGTLQSSLKSYPNEEQILGTFKTLEEAETEFQSIIVRYNHDENVCFIKSAKAAQNDV